MAAFPMDDQVLADEIILRLNKLLEDDDVRLLMELLIEKRVRVGEKFLAHPTIQAVADPDDSANLSVGFLGVLNGLIGADPQLVGARRGWGYIAANFDDNMKLTNFQRVVNAKQSTS